MTINNIAKRIGKRNWQEISDQWLEYIQSIDFPISYEHESNNPCLILEDVFDFVKKLEEQSTQKDHFMEIPGAHQNLFIQTVFLSYKGINSLKSAQCDQIGGYKSWSINNYYQSSFFFCKAALGLLGVGFFRTESNKELIIDVFPDYGSDKKKAKRLKDEKQSKVHIFRQPEHHDVWRIFQRLISITGELCICEHFSKLICALDPKIFAKQRNKLIYHNTRWIFEDLKSEVIDTDFGIEETDQDEVEDSESFSLFVSFQMGNFVRKLFSVISEKSERFLPEKELLFGAYESSNNLIFKKALNNYSKSKAGS